MKQIILPRVTLSILLRPMKTTRSTVFLVLTRSLPRLK
jgi:hypothetical protein